MLSFDTTHAITGCLVHTEADLDAAGWGHPPLLALLHDQPCSDTFQPPGGERLRRISVDLVPISPIDLAGHPTGLPGSLRDIATHLTTRLSAYLAADPAPPPAPGHSPVGVTAVLAGLHAARRGSRPGVPVRVLAWALLYEDISAVTADGPDEVDDVGEVRRVDAVDSDGRVYQVTRRRHEPAAVVLIDDQPDPRDTPATVPALAAPLSATTIPATTIPATDLSGTTIPGTELPAPDAAGTTATPAGPGPVAALPAGARLLTVDEAIALLATRAHPDAATATRALDRALIHAIRAGTVLACQLADGQISFTRATT